MRGIPLIIRFVSLDNLSTFDLLIDGFVRGAVATISLKRTMGLNYTLSTITML
jgi:hypothetical protein